jgi:hypothetical protein
MIIMIDPLIRAMLNTALMVAAKTKRPIVL